MISEFYAAFDSVYHFIGKPFVVYVTARLRKPFNGTHFGRQEEIVHVYNLSAEILCKLLRKDSFARGAASVNADNGAWFNVDCFFCG